MNDIMTVDHGIVRFCKSSVRGAVNRTVAVACSPRFLAKCLNLMQRKMEGQRGDACTRELTHTHTHTRLLLSHNLCVEWSANQHILQGGLITPSYTWPSDNLSKELIAYCCLAYHRSADSSAVIKRAWRHLCCYSIPLFGSRLFYDLTCFCPTSSECFQLQEHFMKYIY